MKVGDRVQFDGDDENQYLADLDDLEVI